MMPPYEHRTSFLDPSAILGTLRSVLLEPGATFSEMSPTGDMMPALTYAAILSAIGGFVGALLQMALRLVTTLSSLGGSESPAADLTAFLAASVAGLLGGVVFGVIGMIAGVFLFAAFVHGILALLGATSQAYTETVRALAYVTGSVNLVGAVPVVGWIFAPVAAVVYPILALAKVHRCSPWSAAIAVMVPVLVLAALLVVVVIAVVVAFGAVLGSIFG